MPPTETTQPARERPDPLIDEVRAIRKAISDECGNDPARLIDDLRREQLTGGRRIISAPPYPPAPASGVSA